MSRAASLLARLKEHFNESKMLFKKENLWKTQAVHLGYKVRLGTHPKTGGVESYWTAKDKEGNDRGYFDKESGKGELQAPK